MEEVSPYFIAIIAAWVIAQGAKYLIISIKTRSIRHLRQLYLSGNMPSAHSAAVASLAVLIGCREGVDSAIFAFAMLFAAIVMYDAIMVRRSSGEQGAALHALIRETKSDVSLPRIAKGHTPVEVAAGAFLGTVIGIVVFLAT